MRSAQFFDNLNDAVRENPVAAGLIGVGLAWIVFGGSRTVVRDTQGVVRAAKDTVGTAIDAVTETAEPVAGVVDHIRRTAGEMGDTVSGGIKAAASKVSNAVGDGSSASVRGADAYDERRLRSLGRDLVEILERQPLALATIGVGIGAVIATAFPRSAGEDRLVGSSAAVLKEMASDTANTASGRAAAAIDAATDEAIAQGLTPEAAIDALKTGTTKLKNVAQAGIEVVQGK